MQRGRDLRPAIQIEIEQAATKLFEACKGHLGTKDAEYFADMMYGDGYPLGGAGMALDVALSNGYTLDNEAEGIVKSLLGMSDNSPLRWAYDRALAARELAVAA